LQKKLKPPTRESLWDACRELIANFCAEGHGEPTFLEQLLGLVSAFKDPETVAMLADLASRFPKLPQLSHEIRLAVLSTLVDTPPPQPPLFWSEILKQDPERYAALALSGVLATNPAQAIQMLTAMPDTQRSGQAAALKLDLAWGILWPRKNASNSSRLLLRCSITVVAVLPASSGFGSAPNNHPARPIYILALRPPWRTLLARRIARGYSLQDSALAWS
jgi:hypothetical protein